MRIFAAAVAAAVSAAFLAGGAFAQEARYTKQKVVYHINVDGGEQDKAYRAAMQNIQNHIDAVGVANIDIKVVMHGNGLGVLKNATTNDALKSQVVGLKRQNVAFEVCENTLKGRKIDFQKDLFEVGKGDIVPSGVAEIARLQQMGYVYIKP